MIKADLYEKNIHLNAYVSTADCRACGFKDRDEFLGKLRGGLLRPAHCSRMDNQRFLSLLWAARPLEVLPEVEVLQLPSPGPAGLFPVNDPDHHSPVLISGNSSLTMEVLTSVLSTTLSPFWYLVVDTYGHTVDMALVYKVLTAECILQGLNREEVASKVQASHIYLPGLAASLAKEIHEETGRAVTPGPVCAAELPLFFGEKGWRIPDGFL